MTRLTIDLSCSHGMVGMHTGHVVDVGLRSDVLLAPVQRESNGVDMGAGCNVTSGSHPATATCEK